MYGGIPKLEMRLEQTMERRFSAVILVGPAGCGKTTLGRELARRLGVPLGETGEIVARNLAAHVAATTLLPYDGVISRMRDFKYAWRTDLVSLGDIMVGVRGDCLIEGASKLSPPDKTAVISGVRRHAEVSARLSSGQYDLWVRVDRPGHALNVDDRYDLANIEAFLPEGRCRFAVVQMDSPEQAGQMADGLIKEFGLLQ